MKKYKLHTSHRKLLSDTLTPVSIYLKLRDRFSNTILLESSDYLGTENNFSYVCFNPIASVKVDNEQIHLSYPDGTETVTDIRAKQDVVIAVDEFSKSFETEEHDFGFINNGIFGYTCYDAVRYFEDVNIVKRSEEEIPDIYYSVYQNIIAIDHKKNEAYVFSHHYNADDDNLDKVIALIKMPIYSSYSFDLDGDELSNCGEVEFKNNVSVGKEHCHKGDIFQVVFSRRFEQQFKGDEFNVYRALRSINPSPYLFYFDYGSFKIFGSSPEAQLVVNGEKATLHPIAGTFKRTGNDVDDAALAIQLSEDDKENSEHVMLVDLARNDLGRHGVDVEVAKFKEVQYYSHVIHLVSEVVAKKNKDVCTMQLVADTFPAGTLSGAPKHMALNLIEKYENLNRGFYGGCIGFMDFNGDFNNAIMIRSFLSIDGKLIFQAGAGIVSESDEEKELQEVNNKLAALRNAIKAAEEL